MKKKFLLLTVIIIGVLLKISFASKQKTTTVVTTVESNQNKLVVLELFTSQGCSSCPPADKLTGEYAKKNPNSIILSFHVDYWNRLGWTDPFSKKAYSDRQSEYANFFKANSVYTPQLVVNGTSEFTGSNDAKLQQAVSRAINEKPLGTISISEKSIQDNKVSLVFSSEDPTAAAYYSAILVQHEASTFIKAGENEGLQLTNYNIVRDLATISKPKNNSSSAASLQLPKGYTKENFSIVLLLQESNTGKIVAVGKTTL